MIKSDREDNYKRFLFQINAVLLILIFICEYEKKTCMTFSIKILCSTSVFNIDDNQKCFLSILGLYCTFEQINAALVSRRDARNMKTSH